MNDRDLQAGLRQQTGPCPACGGTLDGHSYRDLASARMGSEDRDLVAGLIADERWREAAAFQCANALEDIGCWRLIRCPERGVALVEILLAIGIWAEDRPLRSRVLDTSASELDAALPSGAWTPL